MATSSFSRRESKDIGEETQKKEGRHLQALPKKNEDCHPSPLDNLRRGWPPPASVEDMRGEEHGSGEEIIATPSSLEEEGGLPSLASFEEGRGWPPHASLEEGRGWQSLPFRMRERASFEREENREGTNEREYGRPAS